MKNAIILTISFIILLCYQLPVYAAKDDCTNLHGQGFEPIQKVDSENLNVKNDYDAVIAEDTSEGITYLSFVGGSQPIPNACGLNPKNASLNWAGWGGPVDTDNAAIGHGTGKRNEIVIGGVYFERGLGVHANAKLIYDLTGGNYTQFQGYVGMSDEMDPANCGHGGNAIFSFNIDGRRAFESDLIPGSQNGENIAPVKVEFAIPITAKELEIIIDGDGNIGCDHASIGDAKLIGEGVSSRVIDTEISTPITTSQRKVKALYFLPNDRALQWHVPAAINTQLKEVQKLYAEQMDSHGYGRKTFEIETDTNDNVVVHHMTGQHNDAFYHTGTLDKIHDEVKTRFDTRKHVYLIVVDIGTERIDGKCGIAWYYGGPAFVPASGYCLDGEGGITLIAHELGHAFSLEHDFRDESYFMSYGHTLRKFSACAAAVLDVNPFFSEAGGFSKTRGAITITSPTTYPKNGRSHTINFQVRDGDGIYQVDFLIPRGAVDVTTNSLERSIFSCEKLNNVQKASVSFQLPGRFMQFDSAFVSVRVIDKYGEVTVRDWTFNPTDSDSNPQQNHTDVNRDGEVNLVDLVIVASRYGEKITGNPTPNPDVNRDGVVDIKDISLITEELPIAAAPSLQQPIQTQLLPNYPNPFNPETWIPYQLAVPSDVSISIYSADGQRVRRLALGHQPIGIYESRSHAAYWDGRNAFGEPVASGVYFYTFTAGGFTATRKMLVRK